MSITIHPDEVILLLKAKEKLIADIRYLPKYPTIASAVGIHPKTLAQHFRLYFGVSMYECFIAERMKEAKRLLLKGYQVKEVALMVGYSKINVNTRKSRFLTYIICIAG